MQKNRQGTSKLSDMQTRFCFTSAISYCHVLIERLAAWWSAWTGKHVITAFMLFRVTTKERSKLGTRMNGGGAADCFTTLCKGEPSSTWATRDRKQSHKQCCAIQPPTAPFAVSWPVFGTLTDISLLSTNKKCYFIVKCSSKERVQWSDWRIIFDTAMNEKFVEKKRYNTTRKRCR